MYFISKKMRDRYGPNNPTSDERNFISPFSCFDLYIEKDGNYLRIISFLN